MSSASCRMSYASRFVAAPRLISFLGSRQGFPFLTCSAATYSSLFFVQGSGRGCSTNRFGRMGLLTGTPPSEITSQTLFPRPGPRRGSATAAKSAGWDVSQGWANENSLGTAGSSVAHTQFCFFGTIHKHVPISISQPFPPHVHPMTSLSYPLPSTLQLSSVSEY